MPQRRDRLATVAPARGGSGLDRPLGAHMSIAGGLPKAVERAGSVGATALQIFTKNQVQWATPALSAETVSAFRAAIEGSRIRFLCAHAGYLLNLASPEADLRQRSVAALAEDMTRAEALGCDCLVLHPGSPVADDRETGLARVVSGLRTVLRRTARLRVAIALENTAGQGACLGADIAELAAIMDGLGGHPRLALCLDTCHAFAAGHDLRSPQAVARLVDEVDRRIGLARLRLLHLNDSRGDCGCRLDRHAHIGQGRIGVPGFRAVLGEPRLRRIPGIIETPKDEVTLEEDRQNLARLRRYDRTAAGPRVAVSHSCRVFSQE